MPYSEYCFDLHLSQGNLEDVNLGQACEKTNKTLNSKIKSQLLRYL